MKVYEIHDRAGSNSLALVERPDPHPSYGQIVVRVLWLMPMLLCTQSK